MMRPDPAKLLLAIRQMQDGEGLRVLKQHFDTPEGLELMARTFDPEGWARSVSHPDEYDDAEAWRAHQVAAMRKVLKAVGLV